MPFRGHPHHQLAHEPRDPSDPSLLGQQFQVAQIAYAPPWSSSRFGRNERDRKEHGLEDSQWKTEAKFGTV